MVQIVDNTRAVSERIWIKINYFNPLIPAFSLEGEGACENNLMLGRLF
jgi:hypothetical protein